MRSVMTLLFILLFPLSAHAKFDPSFTWSTLETPHFLIHYHQDGEPTARKAAAIAEDVHERLVPRLLWEPKDKTHLVLADALDDANGYATPMPYNRVVIFLTRPLGQPGFGAMRYDDWLRLVITHEYTHVLQLDMVTGGLGGALQAVFGRLYFPNLFQPGWLIEGLATYEETEQTAGGRGRSPGSDMVLRMAALEGPFPTLDRMAVFPDTWPSGEVPYLFGESFTRFIADNYGRDKLAAISTTYSGRWFPFLVESTAEQALDRSYGKLWGEWGLALRERFRKQEDELRMQGLSVSEPRTRKGYYAVAPAFSPDGRTIAYAVLNNDEFPGIYLMDTDGSGDRKLVENVFSLASSGSGLSWSPDGGRIYYTKIEVRGANYYNDLYYYDLQKEKEVRLTRGLRARDPRSSPDGKRLVFVLNRMGMTRLAELPIEDRRPAGKDDITYLTQESELQYEAPRYSPDGSRIAVAVWQPGGNRDIRVLDARGNTLEEVTADKAVDGAPAWSADGKHLFFSSDRTGVFNLFAYETATRQLFQVTNVLGGAFTPVPSPDNRTLAFTSYSARGYDIRVMNNDPASWKPAPPFVAQAADAEPGEARMIEGEARPYTPWSTLLPRFWLPWFGYSHENGTLFGGLTTGGDAVERHQYALSALYGPKNNRTWYTLDYLYDRFAPTLYLQAYDTDIGYSELFKTPLFQEDYEEREKSYGLSAILPLIRTATQHVLTIGYRWQELIRLTSTPFWYRGPAPAEGVLSSERISYLFNSARKYGFSISPEGGRALSAGYERFSRSLGSDFEFHKYTADWHEYLSLSGRHHVLAVRAFAGSSTGADALSLPQRAFQLGGDGLFENLQDAVVSVADQDIALRGYPVNEFRGRKAALASIEYRLPLWNVERGAGSLPFFLRRVHAAVFAEAGNAWDGTFHHTDLKRSVGAEMRFDLSLAYFLPATLRLGIAAGLDEEGETYPTFGLWIPLEL